MEYKFSPKTLHLEIIQSLEKKLIFSIHYQTTVSFKNGRKVGEIQHFKYLAETQKRKCKNSFVLEANKYAGGNKKLQKLHLCLHAISISIPSPGFLTW